MLNLPTKEDIEGLPELLKEEQQELTDLVSEVMALDQEQKKLVALSTQDRESICLYLQGLANHFQRECDRMASYVRAPNE